MNIAIEKNTISVNFFLYDIAHEIINLNDQQYKGISEKSIEYSNKHLNKLKTYIDDKLKTINDFDKYNYILNNIKYEYCLYEMFCEKMNCYDNTLFINDKINAITTIDKDIFNCCMNIINNFKKQINQLDP